ncbi:sensor domain-containing protein [Alishewanella sp. d11]|uniref:sensor domain-containing protein n=1 Tax=Alishewanella sp. d11 TaxID=3414030 RepID=UPI003BF89331
MRNTLLPDNAKLALLDNLPIGIVAAYIDTQQLCYANQAFASLTGYTLAELAMLTPLDLHPASYHSAVLADFAAMAQGVLKDAVCYPVIRKDTSQFYADIQTIACEVGDDNIVIATFTDVTERQAVLAKQRDLEQHLAYERSFLKTVLQNIPSLVWLKDPDGRYLACNKRFEQFFNATEAEIVGKTDYDFVDAASAALFRYHDLQALNSATPLINEEWLHFRADNHKELVETSKVKLIDEAGKLIGILGVAYDITLRHQVDEQQKIALSVFTEALEGIMLTDPNARIIDVNTAFCQITGYSKAQVVGHNANILNSGLQPASFYRKLWQQIKQKGFWQGEIWNKRANGAIYAEHLKIQAVRNAAGAITHYIALFHDLSPLKQQQRQLNLVQHFDALTKLPNRELLLSQLSHLLKQKQRISQSLALLTIDLDAFQSINQQFGYKFGNKVLKLIAGRFKQQLATQHFLARVGGNEFAVILPELTDPELALKLIDTLRLTASKPFTLAGNQSNLTACIGITFAGTAEQLEAEQLLKQAQQALFQAKLAGRNSFHIFDRTTAAQQRNQFEFFKEIEQAINDNQFVLYYQPKVALRSGQVTGFEALIRWQHPAKGLVMPDSFIPALANNALMLSLGDWVITQALHQLSQWNAEGFQSRISVNIDSMQLNDPLFAEKLLQQFARFPNVQYAQLELEILETGAVEQLDKTSELIRTLQQKGIDFSLDDFGTGYSSLTFLKQLPANIVKIDQSFIRQMLDDPEQLIITDSIILLAQKLKRTVVAEGVESFLHGVLLSALGCDLAQGYFIAKPMPASDITAWLANWQMPEIWQTVPLLNKADLQGLISLAEHRQWYLSAIQNLTQGKELQATHSPCKLANWLQQPAVQSKYATNPYFQTIKDKHLELHQALATGSAPAEVTQLGLALQHALLSTLFQQPISWHS